VVCTIQVLQNFICIYNGASSGCGWREGLQRQRIDANILNKQSKGGGLPAWRLGVGLRTPHHKTFLLLQNVSKCLGPGLILWHDLSNGKRTQDMVLGMLGVSAGLRAMKSANVKVGREDIFKPIIGNESLQEASNENGVRVVNFTTLKNLTVKSTTFTHRNIHNTLGLLLMVSHKIRSCLDRQKTTFKHIRCPILTG
jgi:hypothetical protein